MHTGSKNLFTILAAISLIMIGCFALWWFNPHHLPHNFHGYWRIIDILTFLLISYVVWHPIVMQVLSWAIASNIKKPKHYIPPDGLRVAFITTFVPKSESIDLLYKTLPAMVSADYPHDTWVLDEGDDPGVADYCQSIGVQYFSRADKPYFNSTTGKYTRRTKGGNHNAWYANFGHLYDIVASVDTDFVPSKSFLTKTLGQFNDPQVGFVGTPQVYGNTNQSFIAKGAAEQTYIFYGSIMRGMNGMDGTLLIGANHIIRVKALRSVDYYSAHLTEDLITGMKLHAKGWKSVYINEVLAVGEGPATWEAYFNQQMRWAYGCIDIFFKHSRHLFKHMSLRRKVYYFWLQQHYFSGLATFLGLAGIGLYFFFGVNTSRVDGRTFWPMYGAVLICCCVMTRQLRKFNIRPGLERGWMLPGKILCIMCLPIFLMALIGILRGKRLNFKVTPKGSGETVSSTNFSFSVFKAHLLLGFYCLVSIVYGLTHHHQSKVMMFWAITAGVTMVAVPLVLSVYVAGRSVIRPIVKLTQRQWTWSRQTLRASINHGLNLLDYVNRQRNQKIYYVPRTYINLSADTMIESTIGVSAEFAFDNIAENLKVTQTNSTVSEIYNWVTAARQQRIAKSFTWLRQI